MRGDYRNWVIFDLDGVLVDSRAAITEAYRRAGVDYPDSCWGRPWWQVFTQLGLTAGEAADVYAKKRKHQTELMNAKHWSPLLPTCGVAEILRGRGWGVGVCSSAWPENAWAVLNRIDVPWDVVALGAFGIDKVTTLKSVATRGMYVDDLMIGEGISAAAEWDFVHYTGQSPDYLLKMIEER